MSSDTPARQEDDLVARLRDQDDECDGYSLYHEAADRLAALLAENARLEQEVHLRTCQRDEYWSCLESSASRLRLANECIEAALVMRERYVERFRDTEPTTVPLTPFSVVEFDAKLAAWRKP